KVFEVSKSHAMKKLSEEVAGKIKDPNIASAIMKSVKASDKPVTLGEAMGAIKRGAPNQPGFDEIMSKPMPARFQPPAGGPPAAKLPSEGATGAAAPAAVEAFPRELAALRATKRITAASDEAAKRLGLPRLDDAYQ